MDITNFILMLVVGIAIVLATGRYLPLDKNETSKKIAKNLSPASIKLIHFLGWTFILFSLYDRYIAFVLSQ